MLRLWHSAFRWCSFLRVGGQAHQASRWLGIEWFGNQCGLRTGLWLWKDMARLIRLLYSLHLWSWTCPHSGTQWAWGCARTGWCWEVYLNVCALIINRRAMNLFYVTLCTCGPMLLFSGLYIYRVSLRIWLAWDNPCSYSRSCFWWLWGGRVPVCSGLYHKGRWTNRHRMGGYLRFWGSARVRLPISTRWCPGRI